MFLDRYFSNQSSYQRRQQKKITTMNQAVMMTDIVVANSTQYFNTNNKTWRIPNDSSDRYLERSTALIQILAELANQHHEAAHYSLVNNQYQLKPECKNDVVRLVLSEFTLCPSDRPLTEEEFSKLVAEVEKIAGQCHENLTLVLSTIPVIIPNSGVHQYVIHVQCGSSPKINTFSKINPCTTDVIFSAADNAKYDPYRKETDAAAAPRLTGESVVNYGGIIPCETAGGAQYTTAIDICLDHALGEAKKHFSAQLTQKDKDHQQELLPNQASHILTSRTRNIVPKNLISQSYVHADSYAGHPILHAESQKRGAFIPPESCDIPKSIHDYLHSQHIQFEVEENELTIKNTPFGGDLALQVMTTKPLENVSGELKNSIDKNNQRVLREGFKQYCAQVGYGLDAVKEGANHVYQAIGMLSTHCELLQKKRSFWRRLFGLSDCYSKQIDLVRDFQSKLYRLIDHSQYMRDTLPTLLDNFKSKAEMIQNSKLLQEKINLIKNIFYPENVEPHSSQLNVPPV